MVTQALPVTSVGNFGVHLGLFCLRETLGDLELGCSVSSDNSSFVIRFEPESLRVGLSATHDFLRLRFCLNLSHGLDVLSFDDFAVLMPVCIDLLCLLFRLFRDASLLVNLKIKDIKQEVLIIVCDSDFDALIERGAIGRPAIGFIEVGKLNVFTFFEDNTVKNLNNV